MKSYRFSDVQSWLSALSTGQEVAIMPSLLAAEVMGIAQNTLTKKLKNKDIPSIEISNQKYIPALYIMKEKEKEVKLLERIQDYLEIVANRKEIVFYGALMKKYGMNSDNPADRKKIGFLLSQLSRQSYERNGVFISAIVHRNMAEPTSPGPSYWNLVDDIHKDNGLPSIDRSKLGTLLTTHVNGVWNLYK